MYTLQTTVNANIAGTVNEGLRVLSLEELDQVSGAFSYRDLGAVMFAGAVAGGMVGWMAGPGGIGTGAMIGGLSSGAGYIAHEWYLSW